MSFMEQVLSGKPYLIAEAADAHYGDLSRAKLMIKEAKRAGVSAIKFQHHIPDAEMLPEIPMSGNMKEPLYEFLKRNALNIQQHVELAAFCREIGIDYLCTPFSLEAAIELEEHINPFAYKIGSGELLDHPTISKIMEFKKPMIISTGMATKEEIDSTYNLFKHYEFGLVLMNCTSAYPPRHEDIHLRFIQEMKTRYPKAVIGHSDHTSGIETMIAAFTLGATVLEKHVTISHELSGPDDSVSIDFNDLGKLQMILDGLAISLRAEKVVHETEWEIRSWAHRSLVYLKDLPTGHRIQEEDIWGKRPGTGVPARYRDEYIGRELKSEVKGNTLLNDEDFKE
jgi:sialic acid synthase SpsE